MSGFWFSDICIKQMDFFGMAFLEARAKDKGWGCWSVLVQACVGEGGLSGVTSDFKHYMVRSSGWH